MIDKDILDELRKITALLSAANNLALIPRMDGGWRYIALPASKVPVQELMNMVDPTIKVTDLGYRLDFVDSTVPDPSDCNRYYWGVTSTDLTYRDCVQIAQCLYISRTAAKPAVSADLTSEQAVDSGLAQS